MHSLNDREKEGWRRSMCSTENMCLKFFVKPLKTTRICDITHIIHTNAKNVRVLCPTIFLSNRSLFVFIGLCAFKK